MSRYYSLKFVAPSYSGKLDATGKDILSLVHMTLEIIPSDILEDAILSRLGMHWELEGLWTYEKDDSELTDEEKEAIKLQRSLVGRG